MLKGVEVRLLLRKFHGSIGLHGLLWSPCSCVKALRCGWAHDPAAVCTKESPKIGGQNNPRLEHWIVQINDINKRNQTCSHILNLKDIMASTFSRLSSTPCTPDDQQGAAEGCVKMNTPGWPPLHLLSPKILMPIIYILYFIILH